MGCRESKNREPGNNIRICIPGWTSEITKMPTNRRGGLTDLKQIKYSIFVLLFCCFSKKLTMKVAINISRPAIWCCFVLMVLSLPVSDSFGQKAHLSAREIDAKFSEVWDTSESVRKTYSWYARTEVIRDGDTVNILVEKYLFSKNGRLLSQVISERQAELPSTILIRQIAEAAKEKLVEFMKGLKVHLEQYALSDDALRHDFFSRATIGQPDANGILLVAGTGVITRGDRLTWWINTNTYSIARATVSTTFEETDVVFTASYTFLPTGLNYINRAEIRVPGKNLVVTLYFYDFMKID